MFSLPPGKNNTFCVQTRLSESLQYVIKCFRITLKVTKDCAIEHEFQKKEKKTICNINDIDIIMKVVTSCKPTILDRNNLRNVLHFIVQLNNMFDKEMENCTKILVTVT